MSVISMEMIWTVPVTLLSSGQDMKERYESLAATRADLVQNAVNLQQLLVKLKQSEVRDAAQTQTVRGERRCSNRSEHRMCKRSMHLHSQFCFFVVILLCKSQFY